ncbi:recombinase family protein [Pseudarthrobacter oxydans]|uniref:recombinase family protein n=1 Tax=Pseudarthrobacter oxydans TaxID=1671 RepID=UPI0015728B0D|nr:recombinase family protein [Pseudarthrobacter oxydans]NSX37165.1 recombinase family protein [Pseudarthrobacter oxydans]
MKLGYARISTSDQDASMQVEALINAGVDPKRIFTDELSGAREAKERPGMKALMDYAREDDEIYFWRLDRIGRSVIDVLNTVNDFTARGIKLYSIMDNLDPTSVQGRMQLAIMATLAEYERELINERVRAGVISAQKRGVRFGPAPMEESIARDRVNTARELMAQGKTAEHAAKTVGWSKATLYRYMKTYEGAPAPKEAVRPKRTSGRSRYVEKTTLPSRE